MITIYRISQYIDIFKAVKEISFLDVQQAFDSQEVYQNKILCPFHSERMPSLHIYEDGYYCFGCGEYGDSINFVARLKGLKPLGAARLIAKRFNIPIDKTPTIEEQGQFNEQRRNDNIAEYYKQIEQKAFLNMANYRSIAMDIMEDAGLEIPDELAPAIHLLPQVEHFMQILASGTADERLQLLREDVLIIWASLT